MFCVLCDCKITSESCFVSYVIVKSPVSLSHPTRDCTLVSDPDPDVTTRLKTLESAVLAMTSHPSRQQGPSPISMSPDACRNWNVGKCRMLNCHYKHVCRVCGGSNPAYACCDRMLGPRPSIIPTVEGQRFFNSARFGPGPLSVRQHLIRCSPFGAGTPASHQHILWARAPWPMWTANHPAPGPHHTQNYAPAPQHCQNYEYTCMHSSMRMNERHIYVGPLPVQIAGLCLA